MHPEYAWRIFYDWYEPGKEALRESLFTLGNGYFGTRGAAPESTASAQHYPGTYIAGVYNRLTTNIAGRKVVNEDMVNCPNWIFLTFKVGDDYWFGPSTSRILSYHQELDMKRGALKRSIRIQSRGGEKTLIQTDRIVHMAEPHIGALKYVIIPENYSGWITVRTMLDGAVANTGVERYRQLASKHLELRSRGRFANNGIYLLMRTNQSRIEIAQAAKIRLFLGRREIRPTFKPLMKGPKAKERIGEEFKIFVKKGKSYSIEKIVSIYTSRDKGIKKPLYAAIKSAKNSYRYDELFKTHLQTWDSLWKKFDIQIAGHSFTQKIIRFHIFHLLQTSSIHNAGIDAGFPARGLHGEAYRGHIFWDEMFVMPFYDFHLPQISQALLLYRYRRLPQARKYAKSKGYRGAMFPWQSGSSGREETQVVHLNPLSGKWGPDYSSLQRHVSFAICYSVWKHYQRVGDLDFLSKFGAELFLSISRFAASLAKYNSKDDRYHTKGIMGPDEFHEMLPGASGPGLKDNAYSNFMIVWLLLTAKEMLSILPKAPRERVIKRLKLTKKELERWEDITHKMNIIINNHRGIISQFDGYFKLKELHWNGYRREYGNIQRMDRILRAEGKSADKYKVTKQADTLMIFYLFALDEIKNIFQKLGYSFNKDILRKNYDYYIRRTSHGSSLSKVVHCYVAGLLGRSKEEWRWFVEGLESDFYDTQGGTTPEGIHAGVMGGLIDVIIRGFAGLKVAGEEIKIDPNLPKGWRSIKFRILFRRRWLNLSITKSYITILIKPSEQEGFRVPIKIRGKLYEFISGKKFKVSLKKYH